MAEYVKQHVVPAHYLRNFTNSEGRLWTFLRDSRSVVPAPQLPESVGHRKNFYDPTSDIIEALAVEDVKIIEKQLSKFESYQKKILDEVLYRIKRKTRISSRILSHLKLIVALQYFRTERQRHRMATLLSNAMTKHHGEEFGLKNGSRICLDESLRIRLQEHTMRMDRILASAREFNAYEHWIGLVPSGEVLATSDHPVTANLRFTGDGLSPQIVHCRFAYPLSPNYLLVFADQNETPNKKRRRRNYFRLSSEDVRQLNCSQLVWCSKQAFAPENVFPDLLGGLSAQAFDIIQEDTWRAPTEDDLVMTSKSEGEGRIRMDIGDQSVVFAPGVGVIEGPDWLREIFGSAESDD